MLGRGDKLRIPEVEARNAKPRLVALDAHVSDSVEQTLVDIVQQQVLCFQLGDVECEKCHHVPVVSLSPTCSVCSGLLSPRMSLEEHVKEYVSHAISQQMFIW